MTVVFSDHEFYLLDDLKYYAAIYNDLKLCYKIELYDISEPFLMQSEVNSINARILSKEETSHEQIIKKRKKKARKSAPNENCLFVERHFQDIISKCRAAGFLKNDSSAVQRLLTGNKIAKDVFKSVADRLNVDGPNDISNVPIEKCDNWLEKSKIIDLSEKDYILPGCSSFIQSDVIEGLNMISRDKLKFDIVVIDPPWTNKSVRRKRSYETEPEDYLLHIPLSNVLKVNSIVAIWVTNNQRLQRFVEEILMKKWQLELIAIYFWVKITTSGQPVCDFNPEYKMPFEPLYIFRYKAEVAPLLLRPIVKKFFLSVPCVVPSRKPPLMEILSQNFGVYLEEKRLSKICFLELFARNLQKYTVSIGDQVLYMQNKDWFE